LSWDIPYELLGIFIKIVQDCSLTRSFLWWHKNDKYCMTYIGP
jgi:hypothetical protein